jgi:hypothetical protein
MPQSSNKWTNGCKPYPLSPNKQSNDSKKNNATKITRISSTNPKRGKKKLAQFHGINPTTFPDVVSYLSATNHI